MRYNNVCIVKLNHHFIALGMRRIDSKSPNGEKGYMYVHIKHVIFQGRTSGLKSTSATSGLQDFLLRSAQNVPQHLGRENTTTCAMARATVALVRWASALVYIVWA